MAMETVDRIGRALLSVEAPGFGRYFLGLGVLIVGVVLPLAYMMLQGQRPSVRTPKH